MIAKELLSQIIMPLHTEDTGEEALKMMHIYHVRHLPVVDESRLLGVLSEEDILIHDLNEHVGGYRLSMLRPFCQEQDHLFEVMGRLGKYQLTVLPVVDEEGSYLGVITMESVVQYFSAQFAFTEPGSILVLESSRGNYSLAEIARIAESEDISILSSFVHAIPDSTRMYITLKLNRQNVSGLKATLERFDYTVAATFSEAEYQDSLKERYDSLMSYLNV